MYIYMTATTQQTVENKSFLTLLYAIKLHVEEEPRIIRTLSAPFKPKTLSKVYVISQYKLPSFVTFYRYKLRSHAHRSLYTPH